MLEGSPMALLRLAFIAALVFVLGVSPAPAQQNIAVRGLITAFDGKLLSVKTKSGSDVGVELPESVNVSSTKAFGPADIKAGMTLGVTTVKRADGAVVAIDVRPIPATAKQGLSPYDLAPESTMTNAVLEGAVTASASGGHELTLNYGSGTVKVLVPPGTAMSQSAPGSRADLKPGETVFVAARKNEAGGLTALRVQVSKDGIKPTQ
jgi:hypothetical protein